MAAWNVTVTPSNHTLFTHANCTITGSALEKGDTVATTSRPQVRYVSHNANCSVIRTTADGFAIKALEHTEAFSELCAHDPDARVARSAFAPARVGLSISS